MSFNNFNAGLSNWRKKYESFAMREGWQVYDYQDRGAGIANRLRSVRIEKMDGIDGPPRSTSGIVFATDEDAIWHVMCMAKAGSAMHEEAWRLHQEGEPP